MSKLHKAEKTIARGLSRTSFVRQEYHLRASVNCLCIHPSNKWPGHSIMGKARHQSASPDWCHHITCCWSCCPSWAPPSGECQHERTATFSRPTHNSDSKVQLVFVITASVLDAGGIGAVVTTWHVEFAFAMRAVCLGLGAQSTAMHTWHKAFVLLGRDRRHGEYVDVECGEEL